MAFSPAGDLYFTDYAGGRVLRVTAPFGPEINSFQVVATGIPFATDLTFGPSGRLFVTSSTSSSSDVVEVLPNGQTRVFATGLSFPTSLAAFGANLYVTASGDGTIRKIDPSGTVQPFRSGLAGPNGPYGITFDSAGNFYFAVHQSGAIYQGNLGGGTQLLGNLSPLGAVFTELGPAGELYVADAQAGTVSVRFGSGSFTLFATGFKGKSTPPAIGPTGLAFDASGNMYVGDGPNVWRLSPSAVTASHFLVSAASSTTAGTSFGLSISALDASGNVVPTYTGTVHFTSSDPQATLPADYTFTAADNGVHTFANVTLSTAGNQTITVSDTASGIQGTATVTVNPRVPLASHTVAYWRFEDGVNGIPALGVNTIVDSSGNNLHGTPIGGPVYRSSVGANPIPQTGETDRLSLQFNGVNQRIFIPDDRLFRLTHSLTLEAYVNLIAWPGGSVHGGQIVFRGDHRGGLDPYTLTVHNHNLQFHIESEQLGGVDIEVPFPGLNRWIHVAGTLDDATGAMKLYINGNLVGSRETTIRPFALLDPLNIPGLGIGNTEAADDQSFDGLIDEVRISDVALTPNQFLNSGSAASFRIAVPATVPAGMPFDVTVTALNAHGSVATNYIGTVAFTSTDPYPGVLPRDYTFTPGDNGTHAFAGINLFTAGTQTLAARDTVSSSLVGSVTVVVTPVAANHFVITAPSTVVSGMPFDVTFTAVDPYGNTDINYQGTVTFATTDSDPGVLLPANYTFQSSDGGTHTIPAGATLITLGNQALIVTDTVHGTSGSAVITVAPGPAAPLGRRTGDPSTPANNKSIAPAGTGEAGPQVALVDWLFRSLTEERFGLTLPLLKRSRYGEGDGWLLDVALPGLRIRDPTSAV
jgi:sugar lactone lactonase YvrE